MPVCRMRRRATTGRPKRDPKGTQASLIHSTPAHGLAHAGSTRRQRKSLEHFRVETGAKDSEDRLGKILGSGSGTYIRDIPSGTSCIFSVQIGVLQHSFPAHLLPWNCQPTTRIPISRRRHQRPHDQQIRQGRSPQGNLAHDLRQAIPRHRAEEASLQLQRYGIS